MVIVLLLILKKIVKYALITQLSSAQQLNSTPCVCSVALWEVRQGGAEGVQTGVPPDLSPMSL